MNWLVLLTIASACSQAVLDDDDLQLRIAQGDLVGRWETSLKGRRFAAFEGIPFAKPPVGDLRFREPQPPEPWYGTLQAKNVSRYCIQWYHLPGDDYHSIIGEEDCLYLNVYTPKLSKGAKMPVIVYIHGGAFIFGTGVSYRPDFLMDKDVVYVNINYRLGPLGFMSTQDSVVPGNNGMKDQVMALQWVRNNIKYFGGNPNSVTVMGMSAGGASVHYHMISPLSKDLFQRGISQSGTTCCPWTLQTKPKEKAMFIGNYLGCPTDSTSDMIKCLKQRPAASIVATVNLFMPFLHSPFSPFAPVIEPADTVDAFITTHPYESVKNGGALDIPWLNSLTTHEGIYPAGIFAQDPKFMEELNSNWEDLFPHVFDFKDALPAEKHKSASNKIKEYYFGSKSISMKSINHLIDSISDRHFVVDVEKCVRLQASINKEPVYLYQFAYSGSDSLGKFLSQSKENYGVSHGDDTGYCLKTEYMDSTTNNQDKAMIEFMTNMIYTFAKYGKPDVGSVEWLPIDGHSNKINYLEIKSPKEQSMRKSNHIGATEFWESLNLKENENFSPSCRDEL